MKWFFLISCVSVTRKNRSCFQGHEFICKCLLILINQLREMNCPAIPKYLRGLEVSN